MEELTKQQEQYILTEVKKHIHQFLRKNYDLSLQIPVSFSGRLRKSLGVFKYRINKRTREVVKGSLQIDLSKKLLKASKKDLLDVAYHEAIHYALFEKGLPSTDGTGTFERELIKHNLKHTSNYNHGKDKIDFQSSLGTQRMWVWSCPKCHRIMKTSYRQTRKDYGRYRSSCCREYIVENGWHKLDIKQTHLPYALSK